MAKDRDLFFVGWGKVPRSLLPFLSMVAIVSVLLSAAVGYLMGSSQTEIESGAFMGPVRAVGLLQVDPYPVVHVLESGQFNKGETVLLSGIGKRGAFEQAEGHDGKIVEIRGIRLNRGSLQGMQLRPRERGLRPLDLSAEDARVEMTSLGNWKLSGEICDGKCLGGSMRPGSGLAHRACANLCLQGGIAPVFVSSGPVAGQEFLLMSGPDGKTVPDDVMNFTAIPIEVEGEVVRHGTMLIFKVQPDTIKEAR